MTLQDLYNKAKDFIGQTGNNINQNVIQPVQRFAQPIEQNIGNFVNQNAIQPVRTEIQQAPNQLHDLFQKVQNFGGSISNSAQDVGYNFVKSPVGKFILKSPGMQAVQQQSFAPLRIKSGLSTSAPTGNLAEDVMNTPIMPAELENVGSKLITRIAKSVNPQEIASMLKGTVADDVIPHLLDKLTKTTKPQEVNKLLEHAKLLSPAPTQGLQEGLQNQLLNQPGIETPALSESVPKLSQENSSYLNKSTPTKNVKRGFMESVQNSPNISAETKAGLNSIYTPKANDKLIGEAKALLSEGGSIDFKNVKDLDKKVAATMQEAINLDQAGNHEAAAHLFNNLSEHGTELGRGVQAFNLLDKMSPESIALSVAGKIKKLNQTAGTKIPELGGEHMQMIGDFVDKIRNIEPGREKNILINEFQNQLNGLFPSTIVDKAITVWKAGLLTSLRTHERNLVGNTIMLSSEVAKDVPGSIADRVMSMRTGQRTMSNTLSGLGEIGSADTRQQIKDLVMRGYDPSQDIGKFEINHNITWDNTPIQNFLKKYTEAVFRPLGAEDRAFFNASFKRSLYDQAGAEAINAGQKGNSEFIKSLVSKPTEQMLAGATKDANYATFHDKGVLGGTAASIKRWLGSQTGIKGEVGKLVGEIAMPFTGVPSSIAGKTVAYSPIGLAKGVYDMGKVMIKNLPELQRQAAQEVGRGVMGTGLFGLGAYLMSKGLMTGQPKDAKEADLWAAEGKQANSVLFDGKWRSINSIGPQNLVMLAGAKYNEEMNKPDGSAGAYLGNLGKDQLSQTFLAGVQGPLNAITDPARYGSSYVGNQASSLVPNIVKDTSKAFDPNQRENNGITDYMTNSIPGLRNQNIPKRDVLGNAMKQEPTGAAAFFDLFNSKEQINNPVVDELSRLYGTGNDTTPSKLQKSQTVYGQKVKLTPHQLNSLEQTSGDQLRPLLEQAIKNPGYQSLADEDKKKLLDGIVSDVRKASKQGLASGTVDTSAVTGKYKIQMAKDEFANSDKNFFKKDGIVYRKSPDGTVTTVTEDKYNSQLYSAQLSNKKRNEDLKGWIGTAEKQFSVLQRQLNDQNTDELDKVDIQNKIDALTTDYQKFRSYGGFKKPKVGKKAKTIKISLGKLKPATPKTLQLASPKINLSSTLPKTIKITNKKLKIPKLTYKPSVSPVVGKRLV